MKTFNDLFNTKIKSEKCAKEIIEFLIEHNLWQDTYIYANHKRWGDEDPNEKSHKRFHYENDKDTSVFVEEREYNDSYKSDFLTMTFEGPVYEIFNYYLPIRYCDSIIKEFNDIISKYGYYYELGYAWSLALYKKD